MLYVKNILEIFHDVYFFDIMEPKYVKGSQTSTFDIINDFSILV